MKRHEARRYGEIDRELENEPREYFVGDFGHGLAREVNPPGFGRYPESWTTGGPHVGRGPKNYRRADERIAEDVNERLTHHGLIDATEVEVMVRKGEVTLRGSIDSRRARRMAEEVAESVSGVVDVENQLLIGAAHPKATSKAA